MKQGQKLWTRNELILAMDLYCKTPFGQLHKGNPRIIQLANLIDRTPSAVALKLANFASLDPSLQKRGIKGARNTSKLDREIWKEIYNNWDKLPYESEKIKSQYANKPVNDLGGESGLNLSHKGTEREQVIKARVNQDFFRKAVLSAYDFSCCITGINQPDLLIAGHIKPWSLDLNNRVNPQNGLALNALHDKAFENGLISISPDYKVLISSKLKANPTKEIQSFFLQYEHSTISLPKRFLPNPRFLEYHNNERFQP